MKRIMDYLLNRQATSKEALTDADLLLGSHPKKVIHFVTFKELSVNVFQSIKQVQKIVSEANVRLIVNGNLKDRLLIKLLTFTIQQKKAFTVVVADGYRALRNPKLNQSEDLAIIIETNQ
ncbi:hypothetical protein EQ871_04715 [Enterococcus casseliflavus]|uniref:hypothetical protein n=1 Tax=Enterococcus casseliflavus TaxID=37734 RepID=UPI000FFB3BB0|nr:hypothetical protein [Enterococcus casseliflavus]RXA64567.1 hypothetical protein EQ871_04715 [Enterococcus casseliflavus]